MEANRRGEALSGLEDESEDDEEQWRNEIALIDKQLEERKQNVSIDDKPSSGSEDKNLVFGPGSELSSLLEQCTAGVTPNTNNCKVLNLAAQQALKQIDSILEGFLQKNRLEQKTVISYLNNQVMQDDKSQARAKIKVLGIPYFKDKNGYPQPDNEDTRSRRAKKELLPTDFLEISKIWTLEATSTLQKAVFNAAKTSYSQSLLKKKGMIMKEGSDDVAEKLSIVSNEIERVEKMTSAGYMPPEAYEKIDWMKIATCDMDGAFLDTECAAKWQLHVRPGICKAKWRQPELDCLNALAAVHGGQDWDAVAAALGTNRTGLQCCTRYRCGQNRKGKWTKVEEERLRALVRRHMVYRQIPWARVAWHFQLRTLRQCRDFYLCRSEGRKKGPFDYGEDWTILSHVQDGSIDCRKVATRLKGRTTQQVRARYRYLRATVIPFSEEEDRLLVRLSTVMPGKWASISAYFVRHSQEQCRLRWIAICRSKALAGAYENEREALLDALIRSEQPGKGPPVGGDEAKAGSSAHAFLNVRKKLVNNGDVFSGRRSLAVQSLVHYESHSYGPLFPRPRSSCEPEIVANLKVALRTLSAEADLLGKARRIGLAQERRELDREDVMVLLHMARDPELARHVASPWHNCNLPHVAVVPPNWASLVGLRGLTLGRSLVGHLASEFGHRAVPTRRDPTVPDEERLSFRDARMLWDARLRALFTLPLACASIAMQEVPVLSAGKLKLKQKMRRRRLTNKQKKRHAVFMNRVRWKTEEQDGDSAPTPSTAQQPFTGPRRGRPPKRKDVSVEELSTGGAPFTKKARMIRVRRV